jgi:hypothetical protein
MRRDGFVVGQSEGDSRESFGVGYSCWYPLVSICLVRWWRGREHTVDF